MKITNTDVGPAIILASGLARMSSPQVGSEGSIALALLLNTEHQPQCYALIWEWGGDWSGFGDGDCDDAEKLNGWEPDAIREAIRDVVDLPLEGVMDDMEWFSDWAGRAEEALANAD